MPAIDLFLDFSRVEAARVPAALARLDSPDLLGYLVERVTCAAPAGAVMPKTLRRPAAWRMHTGRVVEACARALTAAADAERPLLVLIGEADPGCEAIGLLLESIESDPMIGFASPRLTGVTGDSLARLDAGGDEAIDELPRRLLAELPETMLVADAPSRVLLIRPSILTNFGELDERFRTVPAALWHYVGRARRCGFRTLVCNRIVVPAPCMERPCPPGVVTMGSLPEADRVLLRELLPDVERAREEFGTGALSPLETRLARALPAAYGARPSLLLDVRNVTPGTNGTAVSALGISDGLHALRADWDVTLLAQRSAREYHALDARYPDWQVRCTLPHRQYTAALRLSQPWELQQMVDLHASAACNVYLFLDTISWDIAYQAPRHLDGTWQFMADQADGFVFISDFTRQRFHHRFPSGADVPSLVSYLSFDPADYVLPAMTKRPAQARDEEPFIFVVGNDYDHKDVGRTVEFLASAFPYQRFVALGAEQAAMPLVTVLQSGRLSDEEMHRLYAQARLVVFPSFYEGFGFPVLTALAYGRTLLARRSSLLDEIAARAAPHGRIVPFDRRDALVGLIGRLLHGESVPDLPLGTALAGGPPAAWSDIARSILTFVGTLVGDLSRSRWRTRERAIRQLMAAPTSLIDRGLTWPGAR